VKFRNEVVDSGIVFGIVPKGPILINSKKSPIYQFLKIIRYYNLGTLAKA
jgi:hypothetical protein